VASLLALAVLQILYLLLNALVAVFGLAQFFLNRSLFLYEFGSGLGFVDNIYLLKFCVAD